MNNPGITVLICCFNSAARLPQTLNYLANQIVDAKIQWEIIIVDNASTDNTTAVAYFEWAKYNISHVGFRILQQPIPGKNNATKTGLYAAKFDYLLTCDDDNWLFPIYVQRAFDIMHSDSLIGVLGGFGIIEPEQPAWPELHKYNHYYIQGSQTWAQKDHWVYGAGSVCRKNYLIHLYQMNWQQVTSGRKGDKLICGEDVEICFMFYLGGFKIIYDDGLKFKHFIPLKRQNIAFIYNLSFWLAYSGVLLDNYYRILYGDTKPVKTALWDRLTSITKTLLKQVLLYSFGMITTFKRLPAQKKIYLNSSYGTFLSVLTNRQKMLNHYDQLTEMFKSTAHGK